MICKCGAVILKKSLKKHLKTKKHLNYKNDRILVLSERFSLFIFNDLKKVIFVDNQENEKEEVLGCEVFKNKESFIKEIKNSIGEMFEQEELEHLEIYKNDKFLEGIGSDMDWRKIFENNNIKPEEIRFEEKENNIFLVPILYFIRKYVF